jgi:hypothetical protein
MRSPKAHECIHSLSLWERAGVRVYGNVPGTKSSSRKAPASPRMLPQGRSRPFPAPAVIGPPFTAGHTSNNTSSPIHGASRCNGLSRSRATTVHQILIALISPFAILAVAGCNSSNGDTGDAVAADYGKVRTMTGFYEGYLSEHRGQPPANEQAFRDYLNSKQQNLQTAELTVDQMFLSPRDGKPLKWVYGRKPPVWRQNNMICYAYESEPVGGKRIVIGGRGMVAELDETQFKTVFPKG